MLPFKVSTRNSLLIREQQRMFGVKSLLIVEKVLLMRNNLVAVNVSTADATITAVASLMRSYRRVFTRIWTICCNMKH